jgi:hypothetical protein
MILTSKGTFAFQNLEQVMDSLHVEELAIQEVFQLINKSNCVIHSID